MTEEKKSYYCEECEGTVEATAGGEVPECCGRPMKAGPLPPCTTAPHPEMARNYDEDEPCDDGRAHRVKEED